MLLWLAKVLFFLSIFVIFWAMVGYPISLLLLDKWNNNKQVAKDYKHIPPVTILVAAHNEDKVILSKLNNLIELDYPKAKIHFIVASDNSTDQTNIIVKDFIQAHPEHDIKIYEVQKRLGKTNAQNEAQKLVSTEFMVMTDANAIFKKTAVKELMAAFTKEDIYYVTGRLALCNKDIHETSQLESIYWDSDVRLRDIESRLQTITAGNGAIYACRTSAYFDFLPIQCHDSAMPIRYALEGKRAIANHDALAYEKAGEIIQDEFKRKVRMNRLILRQILPDFRILNVFKYKWFTYFYLGHRTARYLLWIAHLVAYVSNAILATNSMYFVAVLIVQSGLYALALLQSKFNFHFRLLKLIYYYAMTIVAQWAGVINILRGRAKPFWDKAESTR